MARNNRIPDLPTYLRREFEDAGFAQVEGDRRMFVGTMPSQTRLVDKAVIMKVQMTAARDILLTVQVNGVTVIPPRLTDPARWANEVNTAMLSSDIEDFRQSRDDRKARP